MKLLAIVALLGLANVGLTQQGVFPDGVVGEIIEEQVQVPVGGAIQLGNAGTNGVQAVVDEVKVVPNAGPIPTLDPFIMNAPLSSLGQSIKNSIHNQMSNTFLKLGPQVTDQVPSPIVPAPLLPPLVTPVTSTTPILQTPSSLGQPITTQTVVTPSVNPITGQLTQTLTITKTYQTPVQSVQSNNLNVQSKNFAPILSHICLMTLVLISLIFA